MNPEKSPRAEENPAEFVTIAKVTKTQGRIGEVAAALFTDFPERFAERKRLFAFDPARGRRRELELENHWFHKGGVVLKFLGVDSISQVSDLTGCTVFAGGREIGRIEDVQFSSGDAPLLVVKGEKEHLIPFAAEFVEKLDLERKQLRMRLPEGLLELGE
jgi:16S rRNA processing protein RimM